MRLALIRHAPTAWNEAGRIQGRADTALSPAGEAMAAGWRLPAPLAGWRWLASPLARARRTAALLGRADAESEPRLAEMDWGRWSGESLAVLRAREGRAMAVNEGRGVDFRPPGGESPRDVQRRLTGLMAALAGDGRDCVAVTHRGVQRAALGLATGWDFLAPPPLALARDAILMLRLSSRGRARLDAPPLLFMGVPDRQVRNALPKPGGTGCGGLSRF